MLTCNAERCYICSILINIWCLVIFNFILLSLSLMYRRENKLIWKYACWMSKVALWWWGGRGGCAFTPHIHIHTHTNTQNSHICIHTFTYTITTRKRAIPTSKYSFISWTQIKMTLSACLLVNMPYELWAHPNQQFHIPAGEHLRGWSPFQGLAICDIIAFVTTSKTQECVENA